MGADSIKYKVQACDASFITAHSTRYELQVAEAWLACPNIPPNTDVVGLVHGVEVYPRFQRMGYASALMREIERHATGSYGADYLELRVKFENRGALALYEKLGYTEVEHDTDKDEFLMRKVLLP